MNSRPWYKRFGSDFISGTLGLTLEEKGAYSIILDLIYDHCGPIADDPRYIAGVCGCSVRRWNTIRRKLIEMGKIVLVDGMISNLRAEKELENSAKIARKLAENGRKGGEKRAENEAAIRNNNDLGEAGLKDRAHKPEARSQKPEQYSNTGASPVHDWQSLNSIEAALRSAAKAENSISAGLFDLSPILGMLDAGYDLESDILPVMRAKAANGFKASSWRYFVGPIQEAREKRLAIGAQKAPSAPESTVTPEVQAAGFRVMMQRWKDNPNTWPPNQPPPGKTGCPVPISIQAEFGVHS